LQGATRIADYAFYYNSSLESICIPKTVTEIGSQAFAIGNRNQSLKTVTFEDGIQLSSIGYRAFWYRCGIETITIPDSVQTIGEQAFISCGGLINLTLSSSLENIGSLAFAYCESLRNVTVKATTPPTIQSNTFQNISKECVITVPYGCGKIYSSVTNWNEYASQIVEEEGGNTGGEETTKPVVLTESGKVVINAAFYDAQVTLYKDGIDVAFATTTERQFDMSDWIAENGAGTYHVEAELWDEDYNTIGWHTSDPVIFN
jgi:hypothetical protein